MKHAWFLFAVVCAFGARAATFDIAVAIDDGKTFAVGAETLTYTATFTNNGPDQAALSGIGISPDDFFQFSEIVYTAVASGGASGFSASGSGYVDDDVAMPAGSSITYTITATLAGDAADYGAQAAIQAFSLPYAADTDPNPANDSATDADFVFKTPVTVGPVAPQAAIFEGKTVRDLPVALMSAPDTGDGALDFAVAIRWGDGTTSGGFVDPVFVSEQQTVTVSGAAGTFTLTFDGQTTGALAFNASGAQVQNSLQALPTVGVGNVLVSRDGNVYTINFTGALALRNVSQLTASGGAAVTISIATVVEGGAAQLTVYGDHTFVQDSPAGTPFLISAAVARGNLIENPGFEDPVGAGQYNDSIPGWTLIDSAGLTLEIADTFFGTVKEGTQFVELNSFGPTAIFQEVPTLPGQTYFLNFLFSARVGTDSEDNNIEISINGEVLGTRSADGSFLTDLDWTRHSFAYVATSATAKIQFKSLSPANDDVGGLIDAIQFAPMLTDFAPTSSQAVDEAQIESLTGSVGAAFAALGGSISFDAAAAFFTNPNPFDDASGHTAVIEWGDGTTSPGTVVKTSANNYQVNAPDYTYAAAGVYQIKVSVTHAPAPTLTVDSIAATIYGPPTADAQVLTTLFNTARPIVLTGADSNTPPLPITFSVTAQPTHGILTGDAPNLTYTPDYGFYGVESFQFTVKNDFNLTASATIIIGVAANNLPSIVGTGLDRDGDGFSDEFEQAAGSDIEDFSSTPTGMVISANTLQPLTVSKAGIKLNFAKPNVDSITFSGTLPVPANFNSDGKRILLDVSGVPKVLTLTAKGTAVNGGDSVKLSIKSKKGVVSAQTAKYTVTFKNGSFATDLADSGLTNADAKAKPVTVKFTVIFNNAVYQVAQGMSYTAKLGKTGAAK